MRCKLTYIASLLAAGAAATAIIAAPIASAASTDQSCAGSGGGTICQSPGRLSKPHAGSLATNPVLYERRTARRCAPAGTQSSCGARTW